MTGKDGKQVKEKLKKLATRVEEEDFSPDLEMVGSVYSKYIHVISNVTFFIYYAKRL